MRDSNAVANEQTVEFHGLRNDTISRLYSERRKMFLLLYYYCELYTHSYRE